MYIFCELYSLAISDEMAFEWSVNIFPRNKEKLFILGFELGEIQILLPETYAPCSSEIYIVAVQKYKFDWGTMYMNFRRKLKSLR